MLNRLRVRRLTVVVFLGFLLLSFSLYAGAAQLVHNQERRLLAERSSEVALLLQNSLQSGFRDLLNTLVTAAQESPDAFALVANQLAGDPNVTSAAAIADAGPRGWVVTSAAGPALTVGQTMTGARADLLQKAGLTLRSDIVETGAKQQLAIVLAAPRAAEGLTASDSGTVAVYLEATIDTHQGTGVTSTEPFHELRAALYIGSEPDPAKLVVTTTDDLPVPGDMETRTVTVGADTWLLVTSARQPLSGPLLHNVPWVLAVALLLVGLAMSGTVEAVARARDRAMRLVAERTKDLETSLRELRVAQQAKSEFLSNMSHELRTPLNAVIGFSDLMTREPADENAPDRISVPTEWVEHINSSGMHLLNLINDILDLAKVEAGKIDLDPEPLNVQTMISASVATLRPLMARKQLTIREDIDNVAVSADKVRLRQILDNLLSNAIKFTPEGGHISLAVRRDGEQVLIAVSDDGVGIAPEDQERVFEEFQQVGDRGSRTKGTGLGLALTRRLVMAHGGSITVESTLGVGSTFTVALAAAEQSTADQRAETDTPPPPLDFECMGTVLVIEDDVAAVRLLRTYLEHAGYAVRVASDGPTGLAEAMSNPPDAIVLDVILPGLDGWEVLRRIKLDPRSASVPVVMVTVVDEQEVGFALGAVDYLVKPIDPDVLVDVLRRHIELGAIASPTRAIAIDDDEASRRVIAACLQQQGVEVLTAAGGAEGLALVRSRGADVVLCDLLMPDMDGYEVVAELQSDPATRGIPILVVTAQDLRDEDKARLNGNILGIVQKGSSLEAGIRRWLATVTHHDSVPMEDA
jgi:signal transduction histidine kinase/CheY-like chemotaxis protein